MSARGSRKQVAATGGTCVLIACLVFLVLIGWFATANARQTISLEKGTFGFDQRQQPVNQIDDYGSKDEPGERDDANRLFKPAEGHREMLEPGSRSKSKEFSGDMNAASSESKMVAAKEFKSKEHDQTGSIGTRPRLEMSGSNLTPLETLKGE